MRLHRDYDDFSFLTVFIAWTATSAEDGATLYVPRSHRSSTVGTQTVALAAQPGDAFVATRSGFTPAIFMWKNPVSPRGSDLDTR